MLQPDSNHLVFELVHPRRWLGVARRSPARTLRVATFNDDLYAALMDLTGSDLADAGVLVGTLAYNFYAKPRLASCAELLLPTEPTGVPPGFTLADDCIMHVATGVRIDLIVPIRHRLPLALVKQVVATAVNSGGFNLASREGLVALKLHRAHGDERHRSQEMADVQSIIAIHDIDLSRWGIESTVRKMLDDVRSIAHIPDI